MRRRIAGLVILMGAIFVGAHFLGLTSRVVTFEIHYLLGDPPVAKRLSVVIRPAKGGDPVARFGTELIKPDITHETRLPPGTYSAEIQLDDRPAVVRTIEAQDGAVVRVDLSREGPE